MNSPPNQQRITQIISFFMLRRRETHLPHPPNQFRQLGTLFHVRSILLCFSSFFFLIWERERREERRERREERERGERREERGEKRRGERRERRERGERGEREERERRRERGERRGRGGREGEGAFV